MTKTTPFATIKFTAGEIAILRTVMMLKSNNVTQQGQADFRVVPKEEELTALETYKEIGKGIKGNSFVDASLAFGTEQKAMLIRFITDYPFSVNELESKYKLLEMLK